MEGTVIELAAILLALLIGVIPALNKIAKAIEKLSEE